jgi:RNA polymerase sigma-70 factor, ECF subfamily
VALSIEAFVAHLARAGAPDPLPPGRAADLFIAAACAAADPVAIRRFEAQYLGGLDGHVARYGISGEMVEELRQQVRIRMLVGVDPLIVHYRATGPLGAWVRVIVARTALALGESLRRQQGKTDGEALEALVCRGLGPEATAAKALYRDRLQAALEQAFAGLDAQDKTLLRLHFLDGLSIDAIGRIYRIHRATAARRLVKLRGQILQAVRQRLALPAQPSTAELRSLLDLLHDEIRLSLSRILG